MPSSAHAESLTARGGISPFQATLAFVAALTAVRLAVLAATPLELYPEEAQYWLWSRHLAFGYFSKPPMIAWLIGFATAIGGDGTFWIRLPAPLLHGFAALAIQRAGARIYGGWIGFLAALLYSLAPGVELSGVAIATDAPLLFFCALALWAYAGFVTADDRASASRCAAGLGLSIGLGILSKYAALYFVAGLALHALADREARRRWRPIELLLAMGFGLLAAAPNLIWNLAHGFETVRHLADNADWGAQPTVSEQAGHHHRTSSNMLTQAPGFILSQFGVFGPVPFAVFLLACADVLRGRTAREDRLPLAVAAPPLVLVLGQAIVSRANANWAAVAYVPASLLTAAWMFRRRAWRALAAAVVSQAALAALLAAAAVSPAFADRIGFANSFKRARGWAAADAVIEGQADLASRGARVTTVAVSDRFLFNALAYYGRDAFGRSAPPLAMWVRMDRPHNEAESAHPLTPEQGQRVLFGDTGPAYRAEEIADFASVRPLGTWRIRLDRKHTRDLFLFVGEAYRRRPRDPRTGLPIPPPPGG